LLGPIAVHPTIQGEGVGGELIRSSLDLAKKSGWTRIVLIGDEIYYTKFGFKKSTFLKFPPPTNPNRLLYLELKSDSFNGVIGEIQRAE
jgi:predicted N-acetyltransferase YhbS